MWRSLLALASLPVLLAAPLNLPQTITCNGDIYAVVNETAADRGAYLFVAVPSEGLQDCINKCFGNQFCYSISFDGTQSDSCSLYYFAAYNCSNLPLVPAKSIQYSGQPVTVDCLRCPSSGEFVTAPPFKSFTEQTITAAPSPGGARPLPSKPLVEEITHNIDSKLKESEKTKESPPIDFSSDSETSTEAAPTTRVAQEQEKEESVATTEGTWHGDVEEQACQGEIRFHASQNIDFETVDLLINSSVVASATECAQTCYKLKCGFAFFDSEKKECQFTVNTDNLVDHDCRHDDEDLSTSYEKEGKVQMTCLKCVIPTPAPAETAGTTTTTERTTSTTTSATTTTTLATENKQKSETEFAIDEPVSTQHRQEEDSGPSKGSYGYPACVIKFQMDETSDVSTHVHYDVRRVKSINACARMCFAGYCTTAVYSPSTNECRLGKGQREQCNELDHVSSVKPNKDIIIQCFRCSPQKQTLQPQSRDKISLVATTEFSPTTTEASATTTETAVSVTTTASEAATEGTSAATTTVEISHQVDESEQSVVHDRVLGLVETKSTTHAPEGLVAERKNCVIKFQARPLSERPADRNATFELELPVDSIELCATRCYQDGCSGAKYDPKAGSCTLSYDDKQFCASGPVILHYDANEVTWVHCVNCYSVKSNESSARTNAGSSTTTEAFTTKPSPSAQTGNHNTAGTSNAEDTTTTASTGSETSVTTTPSAEKTTTTLELSNKEDTADQSVIHDHTVVSEITTTHAPEESSVERKHCVVKFQARPLLERPADLNATFELELPVDSIELCATRCYQDGCSGAKYDPKEGTCTLSYDDKQFCASGPVILHYDTKEITWVHCVNCYTVKSHAPSLPTNVGVVTTTENSQTTAVSSLTTNSVTTNEPKNETSTAAPAGEMQADDDGSLLLHGCVVNFQMVEYDRRPAQFKAPLEGMRKTPTAEICAHLCYQDGCSGAKYEPSTHECQLSYDDKPFCTSVQMIAVARPETTVWMHCLSCVPRTPGKGGIHVVKSNGKQGNNKNEPTIAANQDETITTETTSDQTSSEDQNTKSTPHVPIMRTTPDDMKEGSGQTDATFTPRMEIEGSGSDDETTLSFATTIVTLEKTKNNTPEFASNKDEEMATQQRTEESSITKNPERSNAHQMTAESITFTAGTIVPSTSISIEDSTTAAETNKEASPAGEEKGKATTEAAEHKEKASTVSALPTTTASEIGETTTEAAKEEATTSGQKNEIEGSGEEDGAKNTTPSSNIVEGSGNELPAKAIAANQDEEAVTKSKPEESASTTVSITVSSTSPNVDDTTTTGKTNKDTTSAEHKDEATTPAGEEKVKVTTEAAQHKDEASTVSVVLTTTASKVGETTTEAAKEEATTSGQKNEIEGSGEEDGAKNTTPSSNIVEGSGNELPAKAIAANQDEEAVTKSKPEESASTTVSITVSSTSPNVDDTTTTGKTNKDTTSAERKDEATTPAGEEKVKVTTEAAQHKDEASTVSVVLTTTASKVGETTTEAAKEEATTSGQKNEIEGSGEEDGAKNTTPSSNIVEGSGNELPAKAIAANQDEEAVTKSKPEESASTTVSITVSSTSPNVDDTTTTGKTNKDTTSAERKDEATTPAGEEKVKVTTEAAQHKDEASTVSVVLTTTASKVGETTTEAAKEEATTSGQKNEIEGSGEEDGAKNTTPSSNIVEGSGNELPAKAIAANQDEEAVTKSKPEESASTTVSITVSSTSPNVDDTTTTGKTNKDTTSAKHNDEATTPAGEEKVKVTTEAAQHKDEASTVSVVLTTTASEIGETTTEAAKEEATTSGQKNEIEGSGEEDGAKNTTPSSNIVEGSGNELPAKAIAANQDEEAVTKSKPEESATTTVSITVSSTSPNVDDTTTTGKTNKDTTSAERKDEATTPAGEEKVKVTTEAAQHKDEASTVSVVLTTTASEIGETTTEAAKKEATTSGQKNEIEGSGEENGAKNTTPSSNIVEGSGNELPAKAIAANQDEEAVTKSKPEESATTTVSITVSSTSPNVDDTTTTGKTNKDTTSAKHKDEATTPAGEEKVKVTTEAAQHKDEASTVSVVLTTTASEIGETTTEAAKEEATTSGQKNEIEGSGEEDGAKNTTPSSNIVEGSGNELPAKAIAANQDEEAVTKSKPEESATTTVSITVSSTSPNVDDTTTTGKTNKDTTSAERKDEATTPAGEEKVKVTTEAAQHKDEASTVSVVLTTTASKVGETTTKAAKEEATTSGQKNEIEGSGEEDGAKNTTPSSNIVEGSGNELPAKAIAANQDEEAVTKSKPEESASTTVSITVSSTSPNVDDTTTTGKTNKDTTSAERKDEATTPAGEEKVKVTTEAAQHKDEASTVSVVLTTTASKVGETTTEAAKEEATTSGQKNEIEGSGEEDGAKSTPANETVEGRGNEVPVVSLAANLDENAFTKEKTEGSTTDNRGEDVDIPITQPAFVTDSGSAENPEATTVDASRSEEMSFVPHYESKSLPTTSEESSSFSTDEVTTVSSSAEGNTEPENEFINSTLFDRHQNTNLPTSVGFVPGSDPSDSHLDKEIEDEEEESNDAKPTNDYEDEIKKANTTILSSSGKFSTESPADETTTEPPVQVVQDLIDALASGGLANILGPSKRPSASAQDLISKKLGLLNKFIGSPFKQSNDCSNSEVRFVAKELQDLTMHFETDALAYSLDHCARICYETGCQKAAYTRFPRPVCLLNYSNSTECSTDVKRQSSWIFTAIQQVVELQCLTCENTSEVMKKSEGVDITNVGFSVDSEPSIVPFQGTSSKCPGRLEFHVVPVGSLPRLNVTNDVPAKTPADCAKKCYETKGCTTAGFIPSPNSAISSGVCLLTSDDTVCGNDGDFTPQHASLTPFVISCMRCSSCTYQLRPVNPTRQLPKWEHHESAESVGKCAEACHDKRCTLAQYDANLHTCSLTSTPRERQCSGETSVVAEGTLPVTLECVSCSE